MDKENSSTSEVKSQSTIFDIFAIPMIDYITKESAVFVTRVQFVGFFAIITIMTIAILINHSKIQINELDSIFNDDVKIKRYCKQIQVKKWWTLGIKTETKHYLRTVSSNWDCQMLFSYLSRSVWEEVGGLLVITLSSIIFVLYFSIYCIEYISNLGLHVNLITIAYVLYFVVYFSIIFAIYFYPRIIKPIYRLKFLKRALILDWIKQRDRIFQKINLLRKKGEHDQVGLLHVDYCLISEKIRSLEEVTVSNPSSVKILTSIILVLAPFLPKGLQFLAELGLL